jgi:hypothetical protein
MISVLNALICIPTNSIWRFLLTACILTSISSICFLDDSHSDWSEMESQHRFHLYFTDGWMYWIVFHVLTGHLNFFIWKVCVQIIWLDFLLFWCLIFELFIYY